MCFVKVMDNSIKFNKAVISAMILKWPELRGLWGK